MLIDRAAFALATVLLVAPAAIAEVVSTAEYGPGAVVVPMEATFDPLLDEVRLAAGGDAIWLIRDATLLRFPIRTASDGKRLVAWSEPESFSLPEPLRTSRKQNRRIVTAAAGQVAVIDVATRQPWYFARGEWSAAPPLPDEPFSAAILAGGDVVISTPQHSTAAFAVVDRKGNVRRRFGARFEARTATLDPLVNTWIVAADRGDHIVAAHAHKPLVRRYTPDGALVWEARLAHAAALETRPQIEIDPTTCCTEVTVPRIATALAVDSDGRIYVRGGLGNFLEVVDRNGARVQLAGLRREPGPWLASGFAAAGDAIMAVEKRGLVAYPPAQPAVITGLIVDADAAPIAGATVAIHTASGLRLQRRSDERGAFQLAGLEPGQPADVETRAAGYITRREHGPLREIVSSIVLTPAPRTCVRVSDREAGTPIESFNVAVAMVEQQHHSVTREESPAQHFSSADGTACLTAPFALPWMLTVSADGYARATHRHGGEETLDVALERAVPIEVVVRSSERPIEGAMLYLETGEAPESGSRAFADDQVVTTDAGGKAAFDGFPAGQYRLSAEHPQYIRWSETLDLPTASGVVEVSLSPGARAEFAVTARENGRALEGAVVTVEALGKLLTTNPQCTTGAEGRCSVGALPPGRFGVRVTSPGRTAARRALQIAPDQKDVRLAVALPAGVRVSGDVLHLERYPGAALVIQMSAAATASIEVPVSTGGAFVASDVPAGVVHVWVRERETENRIAYKRVEIPAATSHHLTVELPQPLRVTGRITSGSRRCGGCTLTFSRLGGDWGRPQVAATVSADGAYEARLPSPGTYRLEAADRNARLQLSEIVDVAVDLRKDIVLGQSRLVVEVTTSTGQPVESALVQVMDASTAVFLADARTDAAGVATVSVAPHTDLQITATSSDGSGSAAAPPSETGERRVRVTIEANTLIVRITDARTTLPVPLVSARVTAPNGASVFESRVVPRADGTFALPRPGDGPHQVVLGAPGYALKTLHGVQDGPPLNVALIPGGRAFTVVVVAGRRPCAFELRDAAGAPVALAADAVAGPVPLAASESFFTYLEPGVYRATVRFCDGRSETLDLVLPVELGPMPVITFGA